MKTVFVNLTPAMEVSVVIESLTSAGFKLLQTFVDLRDARCIRVGLGTREMELLSGRALDHVDLVTLSELAALTEESAPPKLPIDDELRDRIAIAAMATLTGDPDTVAMNAYKMANAMLKAREATR